MSRKPVNLLRDAAGSGVFRSPRDAGPLRDAARAAEFVWFDLDLAGIRDKADFLALSAARLGFSATFGMNWDAYADSLQDFSWHRAAGYVISLQHAAGLAEAAPGDFALALEIMGDAVTYWKGRGRVFIVLADAAPEGMVLPALPR